MPMSIPDGVFKTYRLFDITEFKVWNIKGLRPWVPKT